MARDNLSAETALELAYPALVQAYFAYKDAEEEAGLPEESEEPEAGKTENTTGTTKPQPKPKRVWSCHQMYLYCKSQQADRLIEQMAAAMGMDISTRHKGEEEEEEERL
ncbi:hypothetical protein BGZ82_002980, partial [Podila clonocystis]